MWYCDRESKVICTDHAVFRTIGLLAASWFSLILIWEALNSTMCQDLGFTRATLRRDALLSAERRLGVLGGCGEAHVQRRGGYAPNSTGHQVLAQSAHVECMNSGEARG